MWPLTGRDLVAICDGNCTFEKLDETIVTSACTDSRKIEADSLFVAIKGETIDGHTFVDSALKKGATLALVDRKWTGALKLATNQQRRLILVEDVLSSFRNLAAHMRRRFQFPVVGIGGSNGKTTTKEMLSALLSGNGYRVTKTAKSENGFLGLAITLCQKQHNIATPPHSLVLEIGIDAKDAMMEHIRIGCPNVTLLTALGPEHLAGLDNWETAVNEEYKLFSNSASRRIWQTTDAKLCDFLQDVKAGDIVVARRENLSAVSQKYKLPETQTLLEKGISVLIYQTTLATSAHSLVTLSWYPAPNQFLSPTWQNGAFDLSVPGEHNVDNFALAVAAALSLGRSQPEIRDGWKQFIPPEMRSRVVTLKNKSVLFDDSYNASPASMQAALQVLHSPDWKGLKKIAILGDMLDLGQESKKWHLELASLLANAPDVHLCLYGTAMYDVYQYLTKKTNVTPTTSNENRLISYRPASEDPTGFLTELSETKECVFLVKGSRGMGLERMSQALTMKLGTQNGG